MHRLRSGELSNLEQLGLIEITGCNLRRAKKISFVSQGHMRRIAIRLRVNGHGTDAEFLQRADDATGDLAAVGDQYFGEQ